MWVKRGEIQSHCCGRGCDLVKNHVVNGLCQCKYHLRAEISNIFRLV